MTRASDSAIPSSAAGGDGFQRRSGIRFWRVAQTAAGRGRRCRTVVPGGSEACGSQWPAGADEQIGAWPTSGCLASALLWVDRRGVWAGTLVEAITVRNDSRVTVPDIWAEQCQPPKVLNARRRSLSWWLAAVALLGGGLACIGSSMDWTYYPVGETQTPVAVSGLDWAVWGHWTLIVGIALALGGLLTSLLVSRFRCSLVAVLAAAGLTLSALSCVRKVMIATEGRVPVHVQAGLVLTVAAYAVTLLASAVLWALDWYYEADPTIGTP